MSRRARKTARASSHQDLPAPGTFGLYRIVGELGRGGMGVVFEGIHPVLERRVAIKVLSHGEKTSTAARARFEVEARALSRVQHPGIVEIRDYGHTPSGDPYLVMELLNGQLLGDCLKRLRSQGLLLPIDEGMHIARQLTAAIGHVQAQKIVHRDLKPQNIILLREADGNIRAKLLDFGIAKLLDAAGTSLPMTREGVVIGTTPYMSPEQCSGERVEAPSDVYSLGIVLYEMLEGTPPFTGTSDAVMRMHLHREPPLLQRAEIPIKVQRLILRALAKHPANRPSIFELLEGLREGDGFSSDKKAITIASHSSPVLLPKSAPPAEVAQPSPSRRRLVLKIATSLVGIGLAGIAIAWWPQQRPPPAIPSMILIAGKTFTMGSTPDEAKAAIEMCRVEDPALKQCKPDLFEREVPARHVSLDDFYMDKFEVANEQFAVWLNRQHFQVKEESIPYHGQPSTEKRVYAGSQLLMTLSGSGLDHDGSQFSAKPDYLGLPVTQVTWVAAQSYCQDLGGRLPTEAEWELAARGLERRVFPWGAARPRCDGVAFGRFSGGPCHGIASRPSAIGSSWQDVTVDGVHDLGGNVTEWVEDVFAAPYRDCGMLCKDPVLRGKPNEDPPPPHVLRGGALYDIPSLLRGAGRGRRGRDKQVAKDLGFRCARSVR